MDPSPAFVPPARVGQIAIPVRDLDRAVSFYADTLGLRLLFRAPPGLAFLDCGGVRLMLSAGAHAHRHPIPGGSRLEAWRAGESSGGSRCG